MDTLFKKRKNQNIRLRRLSDDDPGGDSDTQTNVSNEDSNISIPAIPKKEKKKNKEKAAVPKKQSVLSFEDELEGAVILALLCSFRCLCP